MPSARLMRAVQPSARTRETSSSFLDEPSGLLASNPSSPSKPTMRRIVSASSRIVTSSHEENAGLSHIVHVHEFSLGPAAA